MNEAHIQKHINSLPFCTGSFNAKVAFIGEAPGRTEALSKSKEPFIGQSGKQLRKWIQEAGLNIENCYISNVLKQWPPGNNFALFARKNPKLIQTYQKVLEMELGLLHDCNVFVPVGGIALKVLTHGRYKSITNWRGSIIESELKPKSKNKQKCIPILHPAALLARNWKMSTPTRMDIKRIAEESIHPAINLPEREYIIRPKFNDVFEFLRDLIENTPNVVFTKTNKKIAPKKTTDVISVDTETKEGGRIVTIQLCRNAKTAICIPFQYGNGNSYWPKEQEILIWKLLSKVLHNKHLVGQNFLMYDAFILGIQGFDQDKILKNVYLDTMEAFQCLQPDLPKSLAFLTSIYTKEPYYKAEGKEGIKDWTPSVGDEQFWIYGCKDVLVVHEMFPKILKGLQNSHFSTYWNRFQRNGLNKRRGKPTSLEYEYPYIAERFKESTQYNFYKSHYHGMAPHRLTMTRKGIKIDENAKEKIKVKISRELLEDQCKLTILAGKNVNVKSSPQMQQLLYKDMKLPVQKTYKGKVTCNEDALVALTSLHDSEILKLILKIRQNRTLMSNYVNVLYDSDKRIRSSYGFTETGRFASRKCPLRTGYNMQNWPRSMRGMIRSDSNFHILVEMDLSQAESRIVAYKSRDHDLIQAYEDGKDIHKNTASNILRKIIDDITKSQRYTGKRVNHAANYDMQAKKFSLVYNKDATKNKVDLITEKVADVLLGRHHMKHPAIRHTYHFETKRLIGKIKAMYNYWGRRMIFHDRIGSKLFRKGFAWYPQSTVGDLTNLIFRKLYDTIQILNQGHDSLVMQIRKQDLEHAVRIMWKAAQIPLTIEGRTFTIPVDFKYGTHWGGSMKELEVNNRGIIININNNKIG